MARRSGNSSNAGAAQAVEPADSSDSDAFGAASWALLGTNEQFMQWLTQAQQMQTQMLQGWMEAVQSASAQLPLLSTWAEMQGRWAQQMKDQTAQMVRLLQHQGPRDSGSKVAAALPDALYGQAQAGYEALMRQWSSVLQGLAGPRV